MITAYIGIGSNVGKRRHYIDSALKILHHPPCLQVVKVAPLYSTAPVGYTEQGWFLNTVAQVVTTLPPLELLQTLLATEEQLGRVRTVRWGPRTIDLDLLMYGDVTMDTLELTLPHPRMAERAFVMVPLADLNPALKLREQTVDQWAQQLRKHQQIEKAALT